MLGTHGTSQPSTPTHSEIFPISGRVKWFDASKGLGFVVPDGGLKDALLHVTTVRAWSGCSATQVFEGTRIVGEAIDTPKGINIVRLTAVDNSNAIMQTANLHESHNVVATSGWEKFQVKWFNRVRGFGFLVRPGSADVFIHMETLRKHGFTELRPAQNVEARFGGGGKGLVAVEIRPL
jgi:CspA family cold shock protein